MSCLSCPFRVEQASPSAVSARQDYEPNGAPRSRFGCHSRPMFPSPRAVSSFVRPIACHDWSRGISVVAPPGRVSKARRCQRRQNQTRKTHAAGAALRQLQQLTLSDDPGKRAIVYKAWACGGVMFCVARRMVFLSRVASPQRAASVGTDIAYACPGHWWRTQTNAQPVPANKH